MTDTNFTSGPVTVVLVHGAFADGSSWSGVIERRQAAGIPVRAVVNPLRGVAADSAYVASVFSQIRPATACRTRRSARSCFCPRARSNGTCARCSPSWASSPAGS
jgi:hypothetical protein